MFLWKRFNDDNSLLVEKDPRQRIMKFFHGVEKDVRDLLVDLALGLEDAVRKYFDIASVESAVEISVKTYADHTSMNSGSAEDSTAAELERTMHAPDSQDVDMEHDNINVNAKEHFMVEADAFVAEFNVPYGGNSSRRYIS